MDIVVLMSTYNGEKYVEQQINSILNQTEKKVKIIIRDDGSKDKTCEILKKMENKYDNIKVIYGNNVGVPESFKKMLELEFNDNEKYLFFCDQDDVWLENKIEKAVSELKKHDDKPAYYYSEVTAVNEKLIPMFKSNYTGVDTVGSSYNTTPAIGCTVAFNRKLLDIIKNHKLPKNIVMHDLYLYRVCLAIDGVVIHDSDSYIYYRQHESNVIGITNSNFKKMKVYSKYNKTRRMMAKEIIDIYSDKISKSNYKILSKIANFNDKMPASKRIDLLFDKNYNSKKIKSNLKFIYDILFNNI